MKRYELAKKEKLNWQVVLIQDLETDIKTLTLESVQKQEPIKTTNKKVMRLIDDGINDLASEELKTMARLSLIKFAERVYWKWLKIYGSPAFATLILANIESKGINIPPTIKADMLTDTDQKAYNRALPNMTYNQEYEREVINRVNSVLDEQAKEDYSARYSLRASAEVQIRQEWHEEQLASLKEKGVRLVWIEEHANCSERCQPWQGKLYSLDGTSGIEDGHTYQPLSNATDIYYTTKAGKTYKNGCISGFNCRHKLKAYTKGSMPDKIPKSVIEKQRWIDQTQRAYERQVRKYESRSLGWKQVGNKALYGKYKALAKKWTEMYKKFSRENEVPFYPSRLDI